MKSQEQKARPISNRGGYLMIVFVCILMVIGCSIAFALDVSVKDYGAKGDGNTDDRLAIQAAIDAVNKVGGGKVNFPEGVYVVTAPNKGKWEPQIKLCNNLKMQGVGMYKSIIKIADNQGAYDGIFVGNSIVGFSMMDIGFDANGDNNPVASTTDAVPDGYLHTPVFLPDSKDVAIQHCWFTRLSGVWAIFAIGKAENVLIDSCIFDKIGGYTKTDWDHSTVRVDGYGPIVVNNNVFTSRFGAGTTGARTAIELHGSNIKFINNKVTGFRYGINVCSGGDGKKNEPSVHQYYNDNKFINVGTGFCIWGIDNNWYDNLVFERNDITIDPQGWKEIYPNYSGFEIVTYKGQEPPDMMENVSFIDNNITFITPVGGNDTSFGMRFDFAVYTDKWSVNPAGQMKNVKILRNVISGPFSSGIYLNCAAKNMEIADNTIIDSALGIADKEWKCAIKLADSVENLRIVNNSFYTQKAKAIAFGIYDGANNLGKCVISGNRVSGTGASGVPVYFSSPSKKGVEWEIK